MITIARVRTATSPVVVFSVTNNHYKSPLFKKHTYKKHVFLFTNKMDKSSNKSVYLVVFILHGLAHFPFHFKAMPSMIRTAVCALATTMATLNFLT